MNYDDFDDDAPGQHARDREFTLSPPLILGLFVVLVILCAACVGFGYSMGSHRSIALPAAEGSPTESSGSSENFKNFKPAAGSPAGSSAAAIKPATPTAPLPSLPNTTSTPAPVVRSAPTEAAHTAPVPIITGEYVVQVAAISLSHQDDAQNLVRALRAKGYSVSAFPEPDKFIHVQAGPFASRATAEGMRSRLAADGYQPLVKQQ